ncbi:MAG: hypothetical protein MI757_05780 [Pirellulales bacterium]|nr:hypothetical protein [Pirellulales bacterium]
MRYLLGITIATLGIFVAQAAQACSCAPPPGPKKALEGSSAVFLGKVLDIDKAGRRGVKVTFEIQTVYKGVKGKKVTVGTANNSAACGYGFTKGEVYLVYCYGKPESLSTGICSRTRPASEAKEDLTVLGEGIAAID